MRILGGWRGIVASLVLATLPFPGAAGWRRRPDGLHAGSVQLAASRELPVTAWMVRCDPARHVVRALVFDPPGRVAPPVAKETGALALVNASYFDASGRPLGLLVSDGKLLSPRNARGWALAAIAHGELFLRTATSEPPDGTEQAVQAGPLLVVGGRPRENGSTKASRRAFVGRDASGRIVLGATDGPVTLQGLAQRLAAPESEGGAGLVDALNLDGGSSTQLFVRGEEPPLQVMGVGVPVFLGVFHKAP